MLVPFHGLDELRQQRFQPLSTNAVGRFPEQYQCCLHCCTIDPGCGPLSRRNRRPGGQNADSVFAMIPSHLRKLIQYQFLARSVRRAIALADSLCQFSPRGQLYLAPHLCRLPTWYSTSGSIFDEATTRCSVAKMVSQCAPQRLLEFPTDITDSFSPFRA